MAFQLKTRKLIEKDKTVCFVTSSNKGKPNAIYAVSCGLFENKVLLADCQMNKTFKNLKENKQVTIAVNDAKNYFQLKGRANYLKKGKYFSIVKKINEGTPYKPKGAVLVTIKEIYALDTGKRIF